MARWIKASESGFEEKIEALLNEKRDSIIDVQHIVQSIIGKVKSIGDAAILDLTRQFDKVDYQAEDLLIPQTEIDTQAASVDPAVYQALEHAAERIRAYHHQQIPQGLDYKDADGVRLGEHWNAIDSVGIYVPGGKANYPSSVLMNALPAHVAGVKRIVMCVPTPNGELNPAVLAAAKIAGVTEIYRVGGAQAIAAMCYGTQTIQSVDKIVGPGNAYVAEAKRQVFGKVGIDTIAGPSEILVLADKDNNPEWIAADLLSQAEHDEVAQSILITNNENFAQQVDTAIDAMLKTLGRQEIASKSWNEYGCIIVVDALEDSYALINKIAPEHLELAVENSKNAMENIHHAGAIFIGRYTPEAIGDYVAGPNHVLPTDRTARFSSGLSVYEFMKRTTFVECSAESIKVIGPTAITLATEERLGAHALSVMLRLDKTHE